MKSLVKHITYPLLAKLEGHKDRHLQLKELEGSAYWTLDRIRDYQFEKLKRLLKHAGDKVPFYKRRYAECGFQVDEIQNFTDIKKIPVLKKTDINENLNDLIADGSDYQTLFHSISGGTTGSSIDVYNDADSLMMKQAAVMRFDTWGGWKIGEWSSIIWPAAVDMRKNQSIRTKLKNFLSDRKIMLQMAVIRENDIAEHMHLIRKNGVTFVRGFPSQLAEVARYVCEKDIPLTSVRGVVSTGEPLYDDQRQSISRAFGCPVFDSYRTREVGPIAQECEEHDGLHISAETVYVEADNPNVSTENGYDNELSDSKIIVTDLTNYCMPFIRYEIGDLGALSERMCRCGRGLPLLARVGGRLTDVIYTPEKKKIAPVTLIPQLFHLLGIMNQFRIIQDHLDHLTIQMAKPQPHEELLKRQREVILKIFGSGMNVTYEYLDRIPPLKSGKYAFIVSKIQKRVE